MGIRFSKPVGRGVGDEGRPRSPLVLREALRASVAALRTYPLIACHERLNANDIHHARQIVGRARRAPSRWRPSAASSQEVRRAHPHLDCAEGMLDRLAARAHGLGIFVEPLLHRLENVLVLPSGNTALGSFRAFRLSGMRGRHSSNSAAAFCPFPRSYNSI